MTNEQLQVEKKEKQTIDISPLSKGKRMLVYLCDLIICFFIGFVIINAAGIPIGKASSGYKEKMEASSLAMNHRDDVLYGNKLLFYKIDEDKYDFDRNLYHTADLFMLSFVKDDEASFKKFNVIQNYFVNILNDENSYISLLKEKDENFGFFDFTSGKPILKDTYKAQFKPGLPPDNETDNMSNEGERNFNLFREKIFLSSYSKVFEEISKNDLMYDGVSFNENQHIIDDVTRYFDVLVICATYISLILSGLICFLIVPLCNRNGKTISMMMMRVERVNISNIYLLRKSQVALLSVYHIVSVLGCLLILPVPSVPITYVFRLNSILMLALLAMGLVIGSFIFLMFNKYNRTLFDYLSRSVLISSDSLDEIYRSKGYQI